MYNVLLLNGFKNTFIHKNILLQRKKTGTVIVIKNRNSGNQSSLILTEFESNLNLLVYFNSIKDASTLTEFKY